jgi:vacuolar-type H+-ATPase subunit F/Vma7
MNTQTLNTQTPTKMMKSKKVVETIEFGRKVSHWEYKYITRATLPDYARHTDGVAAFKDEEEEEEWYDRCWDKLVARAGYTEMIELDEDADRDGEEMDDDDCDFVGILDELVEETEEEFEAEKKKREEVVVVPVVLPSPVAEQTREQMVAEIVRLTTELEAIKEKMRNAMASLGY